MAGVREGLGQGAANWLMPIALIGGGILVLYLMRDKIRDWFVESIPGAINQTIIQPIIHTGETIVRTEERIVGSDATSIVESITGPLPDSGITTGSVIASTIPGNPMGIIQGVIQLLQGESDLPAVGSGFEVPMFDHVVSDMIVADEPAPVPVDIPREVGGVIYHGNPQEGYESVSAPYVEPVYEASHERRGHRFLYDLDTASGVHWDIFAGGWGYASKDGYQSVASGGYLADIMRNPELY